MRSLSVRREVPKAEPKVGANVVVHLPKPEADQLLASEQIPEDRWAQYVLVLTGGYRPGELFGLTWADIESRHGVLYANINKAFDTNWTLGPPKNVNAIRRVPLHPTAVAALERWRVHGFVLLMGRAPKPTDPVFPNEAGMHHRPKSAELLRDDLDAIGCPTDYEGANHELYELRRSFATWLADAGVNEGLRKRLMGHAGVVLLRILLHPRSKPKRPQTCNSAEAQENRTPRDLAFTKPPSVLKTLATIGQTYPRHGHPRHRQRALECTHVLQCPLVSGAVLLAPSVWLKVSLLRAQQNRAAKTFGSTLGSRTPCWVSRCAGWRGGWRWGCGRGWVREKRAMAGRAALLKSWRAVDWSRTSGHRYGMCFTRGQPSRARGSATRPIRRSKHDPFGRGHTAGRDREFLGVLHQCPECATAWI